MTKHDISVSTRVGLELLNNKWYALILTNLTADFSDFMILRKKIRGISTLNLLLALTKLISLGLVADDDEYAYRLLHDGVEMQHILFSLHDWGKQQLKALGAVTKRGK
ncbi:winged helix-turn-helix transcriptional regulator [Secundilactobacillus paracollinoides]|uniref:HTH hxlR-type domain-containing protein n=1 Tax=Secundilactobacillus paracollinoides TaxID=240427 RepID=A0A1B2IXH4_9LACO|nr:winged helix-turn-helix transcriptional regulator [Secundilactobacillus paracollinoides]ANZ66731.1 hypothetical protein AYR63_06015 [Secundilactobacillus paracollinoides]